MDRLILHLDMDAFFASVEELAHPFLRGKPLIICGDPAGRSVVSTASYAARPYGIRSGMSVTEARRRCPHAVFWPGDPDKYVHMSRRVLEILKRFTSQVEPLSIDEAFFELTGQVDSFEAAARLGKKIKQAIFDETGLTCTIGISHNKLLAKLASSEAKPDGLNILRPDEFAPRFEDKPVTVLWGIGDKTARRLAALEIRTVRDLARTPTLRLKPVFGVFGELMVKMARGIDHTPLTAYYDSPDEKSMGHEHTLRRDLPVCPELFRVLLRLTDQVGRRLRKAGTKGRTITVKIRYSSMRTITRQRTLDLPTNDENAIYLTARTLLEEHGSGGRIRLVGVSVSMLTPEPELPQRLMFEQDAQREKAIRTTDRVRDRFGEDALMRAAIVRRRDASAPSGSPYLRV